MQRQPGQRVARRNAHPAAEAIDKSDFFRVADVAGDQAGMPDATDTLPMRQHKQPVSPAAVAHMLDYQHVDEAAGASVQGPQRVAPFHLERFPYPWLPGWRAIHLLAHAVTC
jgi:hypothetical protein